MQTPRRLSMEKETPIVMYKDLWEIIMFVYMTEIIKYWL